MSETNISLLPDVRHTPKVALAAPLSGARLLVETLWSKCADRIFCVLEESYLAVPDALHKTQEIALADWCQKAAPR